MTTSPKLAPQNTSGSLNEQCSTDRPMYALKDIPFKGKGLVATREIPKGTRILSEQPLITLSVKVPDELVPKFLRRRYKALNDHQKLSFLSLHNECATDTSQTQFTNIFFSNCRRFGRGKNDMAVFLEASRINYDCDNNAEEDWNANIKRLTVHAMRNIHAGEEITLSYACLPSTRTTRQWFLQEQHRFVCLCHTCALPYKQKQERARKVFQIDSLRQVYEDTVTLCPPIRSLQHLEAQVRIYNELSREELLLATVYKLAAFLVISHGDLARGRVFAQKGESICKTLLGSDNPMTIELANLARDPSRDEKYGHSMRWKMAVDQVPRELGPHDFDNWLWRREEPIDPPAKALIPPKQSFFSGFDDLPYKDDIGTNSSLKKRHWCFLGEVMEPILIVPLDLQVMDIHGKRLRVHFYTPQMGMHELAPEQAERGHTLAILNARKYNFKFGPPGVLHQDAQMLKSFPLPVAKILALFKEVRQFPKPQPNNRRICHGCGKSAAADSMKRCTGCMSLWYCNKDCQMVGWVTKAHKACCKFLEDPDLRSLLLTEWDEVQDSVSFPLKVADGFC